MKDLTRLVQKLKKKIAAKEIKLQELTDYFSTNQIKIPLEQSSILLNFTGAGNKRCSSYSQLVPFIDLI